MKSDICAWPFNFSYLYLTCSSGGCKDRRFSVPAVLYHLLRDTETVHPFKEMYFGSLQPFGHLQPYGQPSPHPCS